MASDAGIRKTLQQLNNESVQDARLKLIVLLLLLPTLVSAGGIPVIDTTAIARQITQYQQTLRDYANQLRQLGVENKQYVQMIRDYNQQLKEYQDYLRQIQGLKNIISRKDWDALFHKVSSYYGSGTYAEIPKLTGTGQTLRDQIDNRVGELYAIPATGIQCGSGHESAGGRSRTLGIGSGQAAGSLRKIPKSDGDRCKK